MAYTGHIDTQPVATRAAGSGHIAVNNLSLGDSDFSSLTVAQAKCTTQNVVPTQHIADIPIGQLCSRGMQYASNEGASFSSSKSAFFASLPTFPSFRMIPS